MTAIFFGTRPQDAAAYEIAERTLVQQGYTAQRSQYAGDGEYRLATNAPYDVALRAKRVARAAAGAASTPRGAFEQDPPSATAPR